MKKLGLNWEQRNGIKGITQKKGDSQFFVLKT